MNKTLIAASALAFVTSGALAADNDGIRPYVGLDVTHVKAEYENIAIPAWGINSGGWADESLNGINPYVGVQLHKYAGVELGYLRTEEGKKRDVFGRGFDSSVKLSGFSVDAVGTLPVTRDERLQLLGSAGVGRYKAGLKLSHPLVTVSRDDTDTALRAGLGFQYQMTDSVGVRAMARYVKVDFDDMVDNLVMGSIGVNYKF